MLSHRTPSSRSTHRKGPFSFSGWVLTSGRRPIRIASVTQPIQAIAVITETIATHPRNPVPVRYVPAWPTGSVVVIDTMGRRLLDLVQGVKRCYWRHGDRSSPISSNDVIVAEPTQTAGSEGRVNGWQPGHILCVLPCVAWVMHHDPNRCPSIWLSVQTLVTAFLSNKHPTTLDALTKQ